MNQRLPYKKRSYILCFLTFLSGALFFSSLAVLAFDDSRYTQEETVGFAFYKIGNIEPNFQSWIIKTSNYQKAATPRKRAEVMNMEKFRLQQGFSSYYPEFGQIKIETPIKIKGMPKSFYEQEEDSDELGHYVKIVTPVNGEDIFFPYPVGDQWITILPRKIEDFKTIKIPPEHYRLIKANGKKIAENSEGKDGTLAITLQPASVNTETQVDLNGIKTWLMDAKVAEITIWYKDKKILLWEYTAPWYMSETQENINSLYAQ